MKYRPIVHPVDAYQFTGHNAEEFVEKFGAERINGTVLIADSEGITDLDDGDWLVKDSKGIVKIIPDSYFKLRYEPAE